jgi:mannose-1-phosphate guanylyltransferase
MKAIILVGGEGTRLRPLTYSLVKSMVPVLNRPFIEHVIANLVKHGINDIILAMGYKPDSIYKYFLAEVDLESNTEYKSIKTDLNMGFNLLYSLEKKPLGTAGAAKLASKHIRDTFLVLNGDVFSDINYTEMLKFHKANKSVATIALTHVEDPTKFGVVETDKKGKIKSFTEKPKLHEVKSHWINAGVYILEPKVLDYIPTDELYMFEKGVFPAMLNNAEPMYAYAGHEYWIDMGTPTQYLQLNGDILDGKCTSPLYNPSDITVGQGCSIAPSSHLTGPIVVGESCKIGEEVNLIGPVVIGNGCTLEQGSKIQNSVLWDNVIVGQEAVLIDSVIASGDNIGAKQNLQGQFVNHEAPRNII